MNSTSKLLIDEYPLQVLPTLACKLGVNLAIVVQQVHYWLKTAERDKGQQDKFVNERWWIYNNYREWQKNNFPFWSLSTIRALISELEQSGILIAREEAGSQFEGGSRKWYSLDYDRLDTLIDQDERLERRRTTKRKETQKETEIEGGVYHNVADPSDTMYHTPLSDGSIPPSPTHATTESLSETSTDSLCATKRTRKKSDKVTIPSAQMNPMKDEIVAVFEWDWDTMTKEEIGVVQKVAKSLCAARVDPSEVATIYRYCKTHFDTFGPMALATNLNNSRQSRGYVSPTRPPAPLCPTCHGTRHILDLATNTASPCPDCLPVGVTA